MLDADVGKFITDNRELLTSSTALITLLLKIARDWYVGKIKDAENERKEEEANMDRKQIRHELKTNTALTVHLLDETARQSGRTIDDIIENADIRLDGILQKYLASSEGDVNERQRPGERKH
jgi:hypothetical protein